MKTKKTLILASVIFSLICLGSLLQSFILKTEASSNLISVSTNDISFNLVFPGQILTRKFSVFFGEKGRKDYEIIKYPVDENVHELCPHIEELDEKGKDSDVWRVVLTAPPVGSAEGNYACDLELRPIDKTNGTPLDGNGGASSDNSGGGISTTKQVAGEVTEKSTIHIEKAIEDIREQIEDVRGAVKVPDVSLYGKNLTLASLFTLLSENIFLTVFASTFLIFGLGLAIKKIFFKEKVQA